MDELKHYGTPRRSGRYPWGSGEDPEQRGTSFLGYVDNLRRQGLSEVEIAKGLGIKTSELRAKKSLAVAEKRKADTAMAIRLKDKGYSNVEIGRKMGRNESSVRALLDPVLQERSEMTIATANMLKDSIATKGYIDVGLGVENHIGVSRTKLKTALAVLKEEGYEIHYLQVEQAGTGKKTTLMVAAAPGTPWKEVNDHKDQIQMPTEFHSKDGGRTFYGLEPIKNVDSNKVMIRYKEEGGADKDGVIELRRGVDDLSLGNSKYAQVRIGVDGKYFLKGMAMYADNLPDGVDIVYNSNKTKDTPKEKVFKPMTDDPDNPFGAAIKAGGQRGALNIVNEEGDWAKWSKNLSSQVLSKQPHSLIKQQLELSLNSKKEEFEEIMSLTNPAVKKALLLSFADDCDASAVHLKAAALPRQMSHVILPFPKMKEDQIFAPNYRDGEQVVLIRHPHGGTFEIPQLTVNNKQPLIRRLIGNAKDAVGIHPKVAEQLSGADFDGDSVIVIPTNGKTIKRSSPLKALQNFNPKEAYPAYDGMPKMTDKTKQMKMGDISNLITDMTIKGANDTEIARAVKHSMVVIDAEKHNLNYKQSYIDNGVAALKKKYQGSEKAGASTLISKASSEKRVPDRKDQYKIDPKTGKKIYEYTGESYVNKKGVLVKKTIKSTKMDEIDDARKLSSGTLKENTYANYANDLKSLANKARKTLVETKAITYSPSANKTYAKEVASLKAQLNIALKNAPIERQAQLFANKVVAAKKEANPDIDFKTLQKIKGQAITEARSRVGAGKQRIDIKPKEWEAIQAGALSNNTLVQVLKNTDLDKVKTLATPRTSTTLTPAKLALAKSRSAAGYTQSEIADSLGISTTVLAKALG